MPTLLEALEEKYGFGGLTDCDSQKGELVSIFVPKLPPRLSVPTLLVLNDCNIDSAGEKEQIKQKCKLVKELDLAQNKLENWNEIYTILAHMPSVEFVNLSMNKLTVPTPIDPPCPVQMNSLRSLVLNNTKLDWYSVEQLLSLLPVLEELHLSLNEYTHVLIDTQDVDDDVEVGEVPHDDDDETADESAIECMCRQDASYKRSDSTSSMYKKTNAHEGVKKLHLTGNWLEDWCEIARVGRIFPNLEALVLADCPIKSLTPHCDNNSINKTTHEVPHEYFKKLALLNLASAKLSTWDEIDRLAQFPSLTNLRTQNWPLWEKCDSTEHERRQLLIGRLPNVQVLNGGGVIGVTEREDAERAFIRYYLDKPESDRPERYAELIAKHGKLDPLVNIDLRPEKRVKITFTYGDSSEERPVDVYRTVYDLKHRLERIVGIPASKMRLFYVDQDYRDIQGPEEMKYPQKQLYRYNIQNGDEIIIDLKK
uniref:CSON014162 protein n=1 Tax=Culicoides sonorensis TaxID=179676 RepID=A0A336MA02_CULSO